MTTKPQDDQPSTLWDVAIIGGGTAGLSAALIVARAQRRVLVLDAGEPRNREAPHMHGVLSRDGYSPLSLVDDGRREVWAAGGVIEAARVVETRRTADGFELVTETGARIRAGRLLVATGIHDELPPIPGLAAHWGRGVVACPFCDGYEARGSRIGVLTTSVRGLHKAHMLRAYSPTVTVFSGLAGPIPDPDRLTLDARGIVVDDRVVIGVTTANGAFAGLELADGTRIELDVLFAEPRMVALDEPLRQLGAEQGDTPAGLWTTTDASGKTSVDGVWAAGNTSNPAALVPVAAGSGVTAAVAINAELVADDIRVALEEWTNMTPERHSHGEPHGHAQPHERKQGNEQHVDPSEDPTSFWERRYIERGAETGQMWSGHANAALEREAGGLEPGTALDLGSGEGGDALWLAHGGWQVTAVDISATALARGEARAAASGLADRIRFVQADLAAWNPDATFDLVAAQFLQSPVELPREQILRRAAAAVAPGGQLLIVGHAAFPSGSSHGADAEPLPTPDDVLAFLELPEGQWTVVTKELVDREATGADGTPFTHTDGVLRLRRNLPA
ncbi:hypothetical protein GY21_09455 [Cryobacterium roopkundense]|uniref:Thioredoxin reductase/SAM-dependent methyltransferase n=1 Tax=Cryobacterium roopkundense TaxID=1001240 RepID=A0A099JET4_9MICO|nr:FAD-dependent oxidoreductase [Cryobacterium roopkundense]KGJ75993.1 hypothetical protein GY21_09455 [Cryobacterium roopkundense]MBB5641345.1 thioredoxin reductase/SAM-dependent methyltransferase [Cryobacterium roopkundense]